ncbi:MAG: hypothetical protein DMF69_09330 [Acidobacteria bacterium]|nr:MAG: hypothetical protein DMF69_09330 [Acidobacteriota bacterium]
MVLGGNTTFSDFTSKPATQKTLKQRMKSVLVTFAVTDQGDKDVTTYQCRQQTCGVIVRK